MTHTESGMIIVHENKNKKKLNTCFKFIIRRFLFFFCFSSDQPYYNTKWYCIDKRKNNTKITHSNTTCTELTYTYSSKEYLKYFVVTPHQFTIGYDILLVLLWLKIEENCARCVPDIIMDGFQGLMGIYIHTHSSMWEKNNSVNKKCS